MRTGPSSACAPAYNNPALTAKAAELIGRALGPGSVENACVPDMGCEEFSLFQERIPGLFLFIGNDRPGEPIVPIHSPHFVFNDDILTTGVAALCAIAEGYCEGPNPPCQLR